VNKSTTAKKGQKARKAAPAKTATKSRTSAAASKPAKKKAVAAKVVAAKATAAKTVPAKAPRAPAAAAVAAAPPAPPAPAAVEKPVINVETSFGAITLELWPEKAPRHVENFLKITEKGQYDNLLFHQVIPNFMILTGCPKGDGTGGPGWRVPAEFNDARFVKGTVGMARGAHRDSAGSQFFICVGDAQHLNGSYTAFGKVTVGQDIADKISQVERDRRGRPIQDVKMTRVLAKKAKVAKA
jgi:peptidyl-prolyl cis-trans isomerase B (cyclophilin B)